MFEISVETHFSASHKLTLPNGAIEPSHLHNWLVTASLSSESLNNIGFVMNFHKFRELLENITSQLNNKALNDIEYFRQNNPSAENVAKYIYDKLEPQLPETVKLAGIRVTEEPGCTAKFCR